MKPYFQLRVIKSVCLLGLIAWAAIATLLLIKNKPEPILIGIDENGVRVITENHDRLVAQEKLNFIKRYLHYFYNYDASDYEDKVTTAGNLMSNTLWQERSSEFKKVRDKFKNDPSITQEASIQDIRLVDDYNFEADLNLVIRKKLKETPVKLRVQLTIGSHPRDIDNPYSWEVMNYVESSG